MSKRKLSKNLIIFFQLCLHKSCIVMESFSRKARGPLSILEYFFLTISDSS